MNMLGICAVICLMIIYAVDICGADCDEYVVVFEETTCPTHVKLTPLKRRDINWDKVQGYPCNSTDKNSGEKKCVVEFDCFGTQGSCQNHIKKVNHQTHSFIDHHTAKLITSTSQAPEVPRGKYTVEKKPHHTVDEEFNTSTYDVNLIYIKDNDMQNSSKTTTKNCTLYCDYAETVCIDEGRPKNNSLSDAKNVHTIEIAINRDENSRVQPIFTGYFPESSNDNSTNCNNHFKYLKTVTLTCPTLKYNNCKQNLENKSSKQINVYIKANFIENNTITKYPECTKNLITSGNALNLKCEGILFAKHNPQILQTPPTPPKLELSTLHCQIELNTLSSKEQRSENSKIHFINCSSEKYISSNKNKYEDINITPISDSKTISINNILTKNGTTMNSIGKNEINIDPQKNPENIITIFIIEKANNCSDNSYFNINEGKIIDMGINNTKHKILQNNNVELILSNCINGTSSNFNGTQTHTKMELSIILNNEPLNNSNLKQFNGTSKDESGKRRILLRCDHTNLNLSSTTTPNKTVLQCESIDLDLYNITGIEITPLSQTSNNKTAIESKNKTKQELVTWSCQIFELNDILSSKERLSEKSKLYFKNCANDVNINNSENMFLDNNVMPTSDGKKITINSISNTIEPIDSTKDVIKRKKTEMRSEKLELNKDNLSHINPENMIKFVVTEKVNNCDSSLNIDEGKIIDLGANNSEKKFILNSLVELKISSCIDANSLNNETQPNSKAELTIILKSESLTDSNLKQFNGTAKVGSVKQRILLRCDHPNGDSNNTVLQCESIDLDFYNITGLEISPNVSPTSNANNTKEKKKEHLKMDEDNHNQTKVNAEVNKNNKTDENNKSTVNNKSYENNIKALDNEKVQKNIPEGNENNSKVLRNEEVQKKISESYANSKNLNFNRKKDIPNGAGQNNLALGSPETERILLIALLTIASVAILIVIAFKACPEKREYNPAPTREPPDEEETAF